MDRGLIVRVHARRISSLTNRSCEIEKILDRRCWGLSRIVRGPGWWSSVKIVRDSNDQIRPIALRSDLMRIPRLYESLNLKANDWHEEVEEYNSIR